ncbi:MAG: DUF3450 domain-containing protein [Pseudomonadales bacterium]
MENNNSARRALAIAIALWSVLCTPTAVPESAAVDDVLDQQTSYQESAVASQRRIDQLDDETLNLLSTYHSELERLTDLETYNGNMRRLRASQEAEQRRLRAELAEIEVVRRELLPLMAEMVAVLERFIELDVPLLLDERRARLATLQEILDRSDVELGERYRRLIEAYQIEAAYGQTIEAYEGPVQIDGRELTVDFLRVGRLGLYYISFDGTQAGLWQPTQRRWVSLDAAALEDLEYALRVARKQAPPNLIDLPLWTGLAAE